MLRRNWLREEVGYEMKCYKYIARDTGGRRREGLTQADASRDVLGWLREQGYTPVSVSEVAEKKRVATRQKGARKRVKSSDLAALCWQLTTMVEGGIPITAALDTVGDDIDHLQLRQILRQVTEKVKKGEPFSQSIAEYPKVFNSLSCAMILAGETSGNLADAIHKLAEYYDSRDKLAKKVKGAIAYPIFVASFITLIVIFIMAFIVPRFRVIFNQMGNELPAFTEAFLGSYDVLKSNLIYIIVVITFVVVGCIVTNKTEKGHRAFSRLMLRLPLFGKILTQSFLVTFSRTMATLLTSGVSVLEGLDILSGMTSNDVIKSAIANTRKQISEGANISTSLSSSGFFPNMMVKMMQVGEESGSLPLVLDRASDHYERKVDATITGLTSMLEPIMIVTVGAIVSVVVVALYLPIFTMSDM